MQELDKRFKQQQEVTKTNFQVATQKSVPKPPEQKKSPRKLAAEVGMGVTSKILERLKPLGGSAKQPSVKNLLAVTNNLAMEERRVSPTGPALKSALKNGMKSR